MSSCDARHKGVPPHVDDLRKLAYVEEIRIGSADNPDSGFSRIRTVRVSDKGDVYVLDATAGGVIGKPRGFF